MPRTYRTKVLAWVAAGIMIGVAGIALTNEIVHRTSSIDFCSTSCHSMQWVAEAYRRGPHYQTASGVRAGCADCHIPYHSSEANAFQYVSMLAYKTQAGVRDVVAEMRGKIDTREKWEKARAGYSEEVKQWTGDNNSVTCRGCHDLSAMGGKAEPAIVQMHAGLAAAGKVNCLDCHQGAGHVYSSDARQAAIAAGNDATGPAGRAP